MLIGSSKSSWLDATRTAPTSTPQTCRQQTRRQPIYGRVELRIGVAHPLLTGDECLSVGHAPRCRLEVGTDRLAQQRSLTRPMGVSQCHRPLLPSSYPAL